MSSRDREKQLKEIKTELKDILGNEKVSDEDLKAYFDKEKKQAAELSEKLRKSSTHGGICKELHSTYLAKNRDYGDAFGRSLDKFGIVAAVTRMSDKMSRIETLYEAVGASRSVSDESIEDTLLDLANYAIMTVMWLRDRDEEVADNEVAFCNRPFKSTYEAEYNTMLKELRGAVEKFGVKADEARENLNKNLESIRKNGSPVEGMCIRDEI